MRYSRNCSEIMVHNFYAILETNDFRWMVIGWDGYEEIEINETEANELWNTIYSDYCKLSQDNKSLLYFATACELLYLETRFQIATRLVKQLIIRKDVPEAVTLYIEALRECKYKINPEKDLEKEIERIVTQIRQSQNKIRLKKDELDGFKPSEDEEPMSLTAQVVKLEQALSRNEIDPKKTSIEKWASMIREVGEMNEQRKKYSKAS